MGVDWRRREASAFSAGESLEELETLARSAGAEVVERDGHGMGRPGERKLRALIGVADIDNLEGKQVGIDRRHGRMALEVVQGREGGHVDGVLGRAEGRRVGEVDLGEVGDGAAEVEEGGDDVQALVHPGAAEGLGAEDAARARLIDQLEGERLRPGVITRMVVGGDVDRTRIETALRELGGSPADVVRIRMFVTDISRWREIGAVHAEFFGDIRPAATMVEVSALIEPELLIEIEADAYVAE